MFDFVLDAMFKYRESYVVSFAASPIGEAMIDTRNCWSVANSNWRCGLVVLMENTFKREI